MRNRRAGNGILLVTLAAVLYGFTPIVGRLTYEVGGNGVTLCFFRYLFSVPMLWLTAKIRGVPLKVQTGKWPGMVLIAAFLAVTTLLLYSSYSYISVGSATTLHFMYPLMVALGGAFVFRERLGKSHMICLLLCTVGIFGFMDGLQASGGMGIFLAVISSVTFAVYMIGIERFMGEVAMVAYTFHMSWVCTVLFAAYGLTTGTLVLKFPLISYGEFLIVAFFASVLAALCLQAGIRLIGAARAALFCMLEPITSVVVGCLVLKEGFGLAKAAGCVLILGGIFYLIRSENRSQKE